MDKIKPLYLLQDSFTLRSLLMIIAGCVCNVGEFVKLNSDIGDIDTWCDPHTTSMSPNWDTYVLIGTQSPKGTAIINPDNIGVKEDGYFDDPDLLKMVPIFFVGLGVVSFIFLVPISLFIAMPPSSRKDERSPLLPHNNDDSQSDSCSEDGTPLKPLILPMNPPSLTCHHKTNSVSAVIQVKSYNSPVRKTSDCSASCSSSDNSSFSEMRKEEEEEDGMSWTSLFWCPDFYLLTLVYSAIKICRTILNTYYKAYGFTVIQGLNLAYSLSLYDRLLIAVRSTVLCGSAITRFVQLIRRSRIYLICRDYCF
eukprot:sb/3467139/